jgi:hypothetical protein
MWAIIKVVLVCQGMGHSEIEELLDGTGGDDYQNYV